MNMTTDSSVRTRTATLADLATISALMQRAIATLQLGFLDSEQIEASRSVMGLDTQLILDGTYLVAEAAGAIVGCGGWSARATLFGGDHATGRDAAALDPATDAARIRAMYTDPDHARRGVGRLILSVCEAQALAAGFRRVELAATLSGEPLYLAAGYRLIDRLTVAGRVPLLLMGKGLG